MLRLHLSAVELTNWPDGSWGLIEVNYCKAAHPKYDSDQIFTIRSRPTSSSSVCVVRSFSTYPGAMWIVAIVVQITLVSLNFTFVRFASIGSCWWVKSNSSAHCSMLYHAHYSTSSLKSTSSIYIWLTTSISAAPVVILHVLVHKKDVLVNINLQSRHTPLADVYPDFSSQPTDSSTALAKTDTLSTGASDSASGVASKASVASHQHALIIDKGKKQESSNLTHEHAAALLAASLLFQACIIQTAQSSSPIWVNHLKEELCWVPSLCVCKSHCQASCQLPITHGLRFGFGSFRHSRQGPFCVADLDGCCYNLMLVDDRPYRFQMVVPTAVQGRAWLHAQALDCVSGSVPGTASTWRRRQKSGRERHEQCHLDMLWALHLSRTHSSVQSCATHSSRACKLDLSRVCLVLAAYYSWCNYRAARLCLHSRLLPRSLFGSISWVVSIHVLVRSSTIRWVAQQLTRIQLCVSSIMRIGTSWKCQDTRVCFWAIRMCLMVSMYRIWTTKRSLFVSLEMFWHDLTMNSIT